jgi:signal transduction histidine kinase
MRARARTGSSRPVEFDAARKDGTRFVASCVATVVQLGGADHWLAVVSDITERVRLERTVIEIANREQQRIGSDLHDGLGQELTGIALMLRGMAAQLRNRRLPEHADVEEVIGFVNSAIENTRALARGLSPVSVVRGGLTGALKTLATRMAERSGMPIDVSMPDAEALRIDETAATHLYRIAQEALTNVLRHSGARRARIELLLPAGHVQLTIADDGQGLPASTESASGLGLEIMRYRARMLGGELTLETCPDGGSAVRCLCPNGPRHAGGAPDGSASADVH